MNSWSYTSANWVYVVLSRVRTRSGLLLNKKFDLKKTFTVPDKLLQFEERVKEKETQYLTQFHGVNETSDSSDSTFYPVHADDDEHDDSCGVHDVKPSQEVPLKSNIRPLQDGSNSNGTTDVRDACSVEEKDKNDDSSIEEMYSDFKRSGTYFGM